MHKVTSQHARPSALMYHLSKTEMEAGRLDLVGDEDVVRVVGLFARLREPPTAVFEVFELCTADILTSLSTDQRQRHCVL